MNWYVAKMVFRIVCGDGKHLSQFDEQLRLISAANDEEAYEKARLAGQHAQDSFLNSRKQLVQWQFINISELNKLSALSDGVELYSHIQEIENARAYMETINKKAEHIHSACRKSLKEAF